MPFKRRFHREEQEPSLFDLARTPLVPVPLFRFKFPLHKASDFPLQEKHILPNLSQLNESDYYSPVYIGWSEDGLRIEVDYPNQEFSQEEDRIELFIDTRDNKQGNYPTKFCHHFLIYPEQVEGLFGKELTKFRGEDTHDLANPKLFQVSIREKRKQKTVEIFIPKEALSGYDPEQFNRIGFTYRVHARDEESQLFSTSPQFSIEQNPCLFCLF